MPEQVSLFRLIKTTGIRTTAMLVHTMVGNLNVQRAVALSDTISVPSFMKTPIKISRCFRYGQTYTQTQGHGTISIANLQTKTSSK